MNRMKRQLLWHVNARRSDTLQPLSCHEETTLTPYPDNLALVLASMVLDSLLGGKYQRQIPILQILLGFTG